MAEQDALILGALLHDIGKFEFRANRDYTSHSNYGGYFVEERLKQFRCLDEIREQIRQTVEWHHYAELADPSLQAGDHASAADRTRDVSTQTRRPLVSVLVGIDIEKGDPPTDVFYYPPGPIDPEDPFPKTVAGTTVSDWRPDDAEMVALHRDAWDAFLADMQKMPDLTAETLIGTLQSVMEKHTARVASAAYKSVPDICLYDHSRSVAAIASCVNAAGRDADKPFLAIQGDVSGIQSFIYRLVSGSEEGATKNTAKRLRGRSFYVWLLTESVAAQYLKALGLYRTNLIFSGGGHFLILAPNTEANRATCASLQKTVNAKLFEKLHGGLGLVTAMDGFGRSEIRDFAGLRNRMGHLLVVAKRRKFQSILDAGFFAPKSYDQRMDVCPLCQADFEFGTGSFCPDCRSHVDLGKAVVNAGWLIRLAGDAPDGTDWFTDFGWLDTYWALPQNVDEAYALLDKLNPASVTDVRVYRLNDTDFLVDKLVKLAEDRGLPATFGYRFLGNTAPRDADGPLEFSELAEMGSARYPMLGIVRMDVDSLGHVFGMGLGDRKSLSRLSTLSREMDTFFLGYINTLAHRHDIYITYSGGDDLFAVGSWTNALGFARAVRGDFKRFCCGNPNLSISGGILLCKDHFPINRAADGCAELEETAKEMDGKDAVCAFGRTVRWARFEELMTFADGLYDLCADKQIPRSMIHHLIDVDLRCQKADSEIDNAAFIQNQMRLKYLVARQGVTQKKIDENRADGEPDAKIKALARLVMDNELMKDIRIPASVVLYRTRNAEPTD